MKKLALLAVLAMLWGCDADAETQALAGKTYQMQNAPAQAEIVLRFAADEPRYSGQVVNNFFGSYKQEGSKLTFEPGGVTMMMGPEPQMKAESDFLQRLPLVSSYETEGDTLRLSLSDGSVMEFVQIKE